MSTTAICGKACSLTVASGTFSGHQFDLQLTSNEIDVTGFGSGTYGDWIACLAHGMLTMSFYERPTPTINDVVTWSVVLPYTPQVTLSGTGRVVSKGMPVDAKGVVENTLGIRITGEINQTNS